MITTSHTVARSRAAEIIGVTAGTLRNWASAKPPRGPAPIRLGTSRQSRTLYRLDEIERWRSDPVGYQPPQPSPASPRRRQKNESNR